MRVCKSIGKSPRESISICPCVCRAVGVCKGISGRICIRGRPCKSRGICICVCKGGGICPGICRRICVCICPCGRLGKRGRPCRRQRIRVRKSSGESRGGCKCPRECGRVCPAPFVKFNGVGISAAAVPYHAAVIISRRAIILRLSNLPGIINYDKTYV